MRYLDEIKKHKHYEFYRDLLEYMFEKFESTSEEDEDVCFEMLGWDLDEMDSALDIGINNGYNLEMQLSLSKYVFNKELGIEKIQNEEERNKLEAILEKYAESRNKNME